MKKNGYEEFIKIDTNNLYINKNVISSFISNANKFFKSFENFAKDANKKLDSFEGFAKDTNSRLNSFEGFAKDVNNKLDYLIGTKSQNNINISNRPSFILNSKKKQPEDSKSKSNSKKSENVSASESSIPFYEENKKESLTSKMTTDSIKNDKKKNIIEKNKQNNANISSTSINSQFFLYKNNINELIDNNFYFNK